jgi:hypothetical protein
VLNFRPIDDTFIPGVDVEAQFRYFEFGSAHDSVQIKAWANTGKAVDLVSSGGHEAVFHGRRTFPYRFLLKHYPIRSQRQAERKIFGERVPRWNQEERRLGWHVQYDGIAQGTRFVWERSGLIEFTEDSYGDYLALMSGDLAPPVAFPDGADRSSYRRAAYRAVRAVAASSAYRRLRDSRVGRNEIFRAIITGVKGAITGVPRS